MDKVIYEHKLTEAILEYDGLFIKSEDIYRLSFLLNSLEDEENVDLCSCASFLRDLIERGVCMNDISKDI